MTHKFKINIIPLLLVTALLSCNESDEQRRQETKTDSVINEKPPVAEQRNIIFFGNSITAGYGLQPSQAFPALIQKKLDSLNLPYNVVNAGVSGETSADGLARIDWILKQPVDVFVLELGGNDGLRGIPVAETEKNLQAIIDKVRSAHPNARIILAGMQIPPNMGSRYAGEFRALFGKLAKKNNIELIPFLLEGVGGEAHLNLDDGIHPNAEGHAILAENVWEEIEGVIEERR